MTEVATIPLTDDRLVVRNKILQLEEEMRKHPNALIGDCYPLKHTFAKGLYIREITMPPNTLFVTKIHKYSHAAFVLRGSVSVMEETGMRIVFAPASFITPAGTKRIVFTHEETVWTTVHATEFTDLKDIEEEIIAKDFTEVNDFIETEWFITEVIK